MNAQVVLLLLLSAVVTVHCYSSGALPLTSCTIPLYEHSGQCVETCPIGYFGNSTSLCCEELSSGYMASLNATIYYAEITTDTPLNSPVFRIRITLNLENDPLDMSIRLNQNQLIQNLFEFEGGSSDTLTILYNEFEVIGDERVYNTSINLVENPATEYPSEAIYPIEIDLRITFALLIHIHNDFVAIEKSARGIGTIELAPDPCDDTPCQNGAECSRINSTVYSCACLPGFTAMNCEEVFDHCLAFEPCLNQGTCELNNTLNYTCSCLPGFTGATCADVSDPCLAYQPCVNGTCMNKSSREYFCECFIGFAGPNCSRIDNCFGNPCNNGTCFDNSTSFNCTCYSGYTGSVCELEINECETANCNNGTCIDSIASFECMCDLGFTGSVCELEINECEIADCNNGNCIDLVNGYTCECYPDYTGTNCSSIVDNCVNSSCHPVGSTGCEDRNLTYTCNCAVGFSGQNCSEDVLGCTPDPCLNGGTCVPTGVFYICDCPLGYRLSGDVPSRNECTCRDLQGSFMCSCPIGYSGKDCGEDLDYCTNDTCQNGGACIESHGVDTYCECPPGLTGDRCTEDDLNITFCLEDTCSNGGTCKENFGSDTNCICATGYAGDYCSGDDTTLIYCNATMCSNGGTCQEALGPMTRCVCVNGYTGDTCEEDDPQILFCKTESCANGGTCTEDFGSAVICKCLRGYMGPSCEMDNPEELFCQEDSCANGGTCKEEFGSAIRCMCPQGYKGNICSEIDTPTCPSEENVPLFSGSTTVYDWAETAFGQIRFHDCPDICDEFLGHETAGTVTRECLQMANGTVQWQQANFENCEVSLVALQLCEASQLPDIQFAKEAARITSNTSNMDASAVGVCGGISSHFTTLATEDVEIQQSYMKLIDNVVGVNRMILIQSQKKYNASSRILKQFGTFQDMLDAETQKNSVIYPLTNFALVITQNTSADQTFSSNFQSAEEALCDANNITHNQLSVSSEIMFNTTGAISLHDITKCIGNISSYISFTVFRNDALFLTSDTVNDNYEIGSVIVGIRANGTPICSGIPLTISLQPITKNCEGMAIDDIEVFFGYFDSNKWTRTKNYTINGANFVSNFSNLGYFGLLNLTPDEDSSSQVALTVILYAGIAFFVACLIVIVVTYAFSRKLYYNYHGTIILNMSVSIICLCAVFIGGGFAMPIEGLCVALSALFQYFLLALFGWAASEAVLLLCTLYKKTQKSCAFTSLLAIILWLFPFLITAASTGTGYDYYINNQYYCRPVKWPFWFGLALPLCIIYIFNWVVVIIISICLFRKKTMSFKFKQRLITAIGLSLLFGLGWGFGLAVTTATFRRFSFIFQVITSILLVFQGVLMLFSYGFCAREFKETWRKICIFCRTKDKYEVTPTSIHMSKSGPTSKFQRNTSVKSNTRSLVPSYSLRYESDSTHIQNLNTLSQNGREAGTSRLLTHEEVSGDEFTESNVPQLDGTTSATLMVLGNEGDFHTNIEAMVSSHPHTRKKNRPSLNQLEESDSMSDWSSGVEEWTI